MLVLSRKKGESVIIDGNIKVVVVDIRGGVVRLGIEAPEKINIFRSELFNNDGKANQSIVTSCCHGAKNPLQ